MVNSYVQRLEFTLESWPEDGVKIKDPHYEYMIYVVLPSVIGIHKHLLYLLSTFTGILVNFFTFF